MALTSAAGAQAGTSGASAGAGGGQHDAKAVARCHKDMATFTVAKVGLMHEAPIGGRKFGCKLRRRSSCRSGTSRRIGVNRNDQTALA